MAGLVMYTFATSQLILIVLLKDKIMKENDEEKAMEDSRLKKEDVIPAEDVLTDELAEEVSGGKLHICVSGKIITKDEVMAD